MKGQCKKIMSLVSVLVIASSAFAQQDVEGSKDHPLFTRMPNFYILEYEEKEFDSLGLYDERGNQVNVEGHTFFIRYKIKNGATAPGNLQILRNYTNAAQKIGGHITKEYSDSVFLKLKKDGKEVWIKVVATYEGEYDIYILEKQELVQEVEANADYFANGLSSTGHVAVYGIYFDTGKAEVKSESEPTLKEIAKLLLQNPGLKLHVVGHTDNVGELSYNMKLSQERADAVVRVLVAEHGVDESRLRAHGIGPLAPVASNKAEEGRSKNRRVELVER